MQVGRESPPGRAEDDTDPADIRVAVAGRTAAAVEAKGADADVFNPVAVEVATPRPRVAEEVVVGHGVDREAVGAIESRGVDDGREDVARGGIAAEDHAGLAPLAQAGWDCIRHADHEVADPVAIDVGSTRVKHGRIRGVAGEIPDDESIVSVECRAIDRGGELASSEEYTWSDSAR